MNEQDYKRCLEENKRLLCRLDEYTTIIKDLRIENERLKQRVTVVIDDDRGMD